MRAQAAWTTPGLMSMLSGLNPPAHGATQRGARLSAQAQTLPTLFRRAGYDVPNVCYQTGEPSFTDLGYEPAAMDSGVGVESLQAVLRQERGRSFFIWYHYREVHLPYLPPLGLPRRAGPCEGRSLVPLLRGEKLPPVSSYAETSLGGYRTRSGEEVFRVRCILDGTWKLVESLLPGGRRVELYNLERDAAERYNFARGTSRSANRVTKRGSSA